MNTDRIEYHKLDLGLAYAGLAPKVSEAWAYLRCGDIEKAKRVLESAQAMIDSVSTPGASIHQVASRPPQVESWKRL